MDLLGDSMGSIVPPHRGPAATRSTKVRGLKLATLAVALGAIALALWSTPAFAAKEYLLAGTFGSPGSGNGQFTIPTGVAVNDANEPLVQPEGGDVYVADAGNERVERFSGSGSYLGQFNGAGSFEAEGKTEVGPATPAGRLEVGSFQSGGIAVDSSTNPLDPSAGDVYVMDLVHKVVNKFSAVGKYTESQLTGTCPKPGTCTAAEVILFTGFVRGIAVDPAGNVWVFDEGQNVDEFSDTGAFVHSFKTSSRDREVGLGVDASDNIYRVSPSGAEKYAGEKSVSVFGSGEAVTALTVNPATSEVLLDDGTDIERFLPIAEAAPKPAETFGELVESQGIAVDGASENQTLYASQRKADDVEIFHYNVFPIISPAYSEVSETSVKLEGTLNPQHLPVTACRFEYGPTSAYGSSVPCEQTLEAINKTGEPIVVSAKLSGLPPASVRHFALVVANANGTRFTKDTTIARPQIEGEVSPSIGSTEATIAARINPNVQVTGYHVQYGVNNVEEFATTEVGIGAANTPQNVVVTLKNLQPGTSYRAQFVASNPLGATAGKDVAFTTNQAVVVSANPTSACPNRTFSGFSTALPDCRAYELVSDDIDETYVPEYGENGGESTGTEQGTGEFKGTLFSFRSGYMAAPSGEAVTYIGGESNSGVGGNGSTGNGAGNQYLSTRGAHGWKASDISIAVNGSFGSLFAAFSEDLSTKVLTAATPPSEPLEAEPKLLPECVASSALGIYSDDATGLHALVTSNRGSGLCYGSPTAVSADDEHILFESIGQYTEEAQAGEPGVNLYDSVKGVLHQVNVLPDGKVEQPPHASFGSIRWGSEQTESSKIGVVSSNGSRIFWTEQEGERSSLHPKALYVRENDTQPQSPVAGGRCTVPTDACTVQLDAAQGGPGASGGGFFWASVDDGGRVFFSDCSRLTEDSTAHAEVGCMHKQNGESEPLFTGNDLYEYNFEKPAGERLTDLTVDHNPGDPLGANVQSVIGTSEDGSYVYIVAEGVLTGSNAEGKAPVEGQPNLYVLHGGSASFVVTLAESDNSILVAGSDSLGSGDWRVTPGLRTAQVSPNGDAVGFISYLELTGYRNYGAISYGGHGEPNYGYIPELFIYQTSTGRIVCASCSPTGAALIPLPPLVSLPGTTVATSDSGSFISRWLVDREGTQAYFMTGQPLVSNDSNDLEDVYEWQSDGSGGCRLTAGCISLISTAEPASNAYLVASAVNGRDVFFTSRSQLAKGAGGERLKLYDARIDGGNSEPSLSCTGTGCQGIPPAPPIFATPSSVTFNGVGNFEPSPPSVVKPKTKAKTKACKRGFRRLHNQCVRSKRKRSKASGKQSARKSSTRRGR